MSEAILLLAHGTPNVLGEMADYLSYVTAGRPMPAHVVEELQQRYKEIGLRDTPLPEGPPLTRWTLRQAELLRELLQGQRVYVGMRNWYPFVQEAVEQMKNDGVTHARVLCLAPQNSRTSTGLYRKALQAALEKTTGPNFTYDFNEGWSHEPDLALAFAENLWPTWAEACAITHTRVPVLFTAHSVPCRTIMSPAEPKPEAAAESHPGGLQHYGNIPTPDPYPVECKRTAADIAALLAPLGMTDKDWFFAFQSQGVAGAPWIGPTVEETLQALADEEHKAVVVQPIAFLCDHVEILYDIDIAFTESAKKLGLKLYRPPSLNDSPTLIRALANVLTTTTNP